MTADKIYINKQGVPCAPTKNTFHIGDLKASCIPIREEDRDIVWSSAHSYASPDYDMLYSVEPYEFEVKPTSLFDWDDDHQVAHIIRPEVKPSGHIPIVGDTNEAVKKYIQDNCAHSFTEGMDFKMVPSPPLPSIKMITMGVWENYQKAIAILIEVLEEEKQNANGRIMLGLNSKAPEWVEEAKKVIYQAGVNIHS